MAPKPPSPQERFDLAAKHATLLRALVSHPGLILKPSGEPDKANIHPTLFNVTDFEMSTYRKYLIPLLPPHATENSPALATQAGLEPSENLDMLAGSLYPNMKGAGFINNWHDALTRGIMIASIILEARKQAMFGGPFDFGDEVKTAATALTKTK